jgi:hypothetical protein
VTAQMAGLSLDKPSSESRQSYGPSDRELRKARDVLANLEDQGKIRPFKVQIPDPRQWYVESISLLFSPFACFRGHFARGIAQLLPTQGYP